MDTALTSDSASYVSPGEVMCERGLIDHSVDQILLIDLGPVDGRAATCIDAIGRKYVAPERAVTII